MDQEQLKHIKELFRQAEHRCKIVETRTGFFLDGQLVTGLLIPSINQLRYVGQHILEYVTSGKESDLEEAEHHCKRAIYDACQAEVLFYLRQFKAFQDEFSDLIISETVTSYWDWQQQHEAAHSTIRDSGATFSRDQYDAILVPHAEALNKTHVLLPKAREELLKKRHSKRMTRLYNFLLLAATVVGVIIATFAWVTPERFKTSSTAGVAVEQTTKAPNGADGVPRGTE